RLPGSSKPPTGTNGFRERPEGRSTALGRELSYRSCNNRHGSRLIASLNGIAFRRDVVAFAHDAGAVHIRMNAYGVGRTLIVWNSLHCEMYRRRSGSDVDTATNLLRDSHGRGVRAARVLHAHVERHVAPRLVHSFELDRSADRIRWRAGVLRRHCRDSTPGGFRSTMLLVTWRRQQCGI